MPKRMGNFVKSGDSTAGNDGRDWASHACAWEVKQTTLGKGVAISYKNQHTLDLSLSKSAPRCFPKRNKNTYSQKDW